MSNSKSTIKRLSILWVVPPIIVGVAAFVLLVGGKAAPIKSEKQEVVRAVRTITVPKLAIRPMAEGYGVVQPAKVWSAIAQVSGRIIKMHPRLRNGEIISAGELLFKVDPINYELVLEQLKAQLLELEIQHTNTDDLLTIEQRNFELANQEFQRLSQLSATGGVSQSSIDSAERIMLNSRSSVQNLRNSLSLIPTQQRVLKAKLAQAERDLDNSVVYAPFNLRIANLSMEREQYVTTGQKLFVGDGIDRSEVVAQVALSSISKLFTSHRSAPSSLQMSEGLAEYAELTSTVQVDMGNESAEWSAEFVRFTDSVDSETRTIGVVVAIDKPYSKIIPGVRPPLSKGMFVRLQLFGRIQPEQIIIPRTAVRGGEVMLMDGEQRLQTSKVEILYRQGDINIVSSGVNEGDILVVSDLIPAVNGMLLKPQLDNKLQQQLLDYQND